LLLIPHPHSSPLAPPPRHQHRHLAIIGTNMVSPHNERSAPRRHRPPLFHTQKL
jgi:hypothetical protein